MGERAIRTIAVAGGGIVALSSAIAFARGLPGTAVTLVRTDPDPAALADLVPTTWPGISRFHAAIGIDEAELVRRTIATHHLGTIFKDWSPSGEPWVHAFGDYGKPAGAIPFDQLWCRVREVGEALSYDRYSVGAALARAAKFVHPAPDSGMLGSRFKYGLRLDPGRYHDFIHELAARLPIAIRPGNLSEVERAGERIEALVLADGTRIEADLYLDCTGPAARIITALDDSFEDWSAWMPFDRLLLETEPSSDPPATADEVRSSDDGWSVEWKLSARTVRAGMHVGGEGVAISRGRRLRPWMHNVLALGDAATALDPLHGMNLDLAQQAILLALELLPGRDFNPLETAEYNRRFEQLTRRTRDFIALHYLRSGRNTGCWPDFASRQPPDSLARTLDQYQYRGRLPFHEEESITRDSWTAALLGMGLFPAQVDPQSAAVPLDRAIEAMRQLALEIDGSIAKLPTYAAYLSAMRR